MTSLLAYCSLRNENLQFAKWQSVVCKMTICSLRNDNLLSRCLYSDILNRKFPPKKPFRPENSDCAECVMFSLPHIKFNLNSGVFERRTATGSKTSSLFICLDTTTFVLISVITLIETICLKICPRTTAKNAKSPLPVAVETPYLNQKRHAIFKWTDIIHHCGFVVYFRTWWF